MERDRRKWTLSAPRCHQDRKIRAAFGHPCPCPPREPARRSQTWVFPNEFDSGSAELKKPIAGLFNRAGLQDARSHDLRRTFASAAADEGYSDATIAALLGHSQRSVTARHYIRRPDEALVAAADRSARRIDSILNGASAKIVSLGGIG
jgi:integrase